LSSPDAAYGAVVPRPPRIQVPGVYHLTAHGLRNEPLFLGGRDRADWIDLLPELLRRYRWTCMSYCVMTTHYHLLVRTHLENLALGMQWLNGRWGRLFNHRHREIGHVFRCRYYSVLLERDGHLLALGRYLPLNPVRSGACLHPLDWPWSSYAATVGREIQPPWLDADELLAPFGQGEQARRHFEAFVEDGLAAAAA
jgi:putative transposase